MSGANDEHDTVKVGRLLAGAAAIVRSVRYCWLVTAAEDGGAHPRPMGRLLHDQGEDEWIIRFVADGRSRKVADMRRASQVVLIFQQDPDDAFVTLFGKATLLDSESEVRKRWKEGYRAYFPTAADRANAVFVEVEIGRMELWIRGITPEPFGMRATILERDAGRAWRASFR